MRLSLLAALAVSAHAVSAQPVLTDSAYTYVSPVLGYGVSGSAGAAFVGGLEVGRRVGPGLDVGFRAVGGNLELGGDQIYLALGPTVGTTRRTASGFEFNVRLAGTATFADLDGLRGSEGFGLRVLRGTGQATVSKPLRLGGSFQLAPVAGLYGTACSPVGVEPALGAGCLEGGALLGVDLRFRVLGADVAVPFVFSVSVLGDDRAGRLGAFDASSSPVTGGIRVRF